MIIIISLGFCVESAEAFDYVPQGALVGGTEGNYGLDGGGTGPAFSPAYNNAGYIDYGQAFSCNMFFDFSARSTETIVAATCTVNGFAANDWPPSAVKNMNFSYGPFPVDAGNPVTVSSYVTVNSGGTYGASDDNTWYAPTGVTQQGVLNISWSPSSVPWDGNTHYPTATISRADSGGNSSTPAPSYSGDVTPSTPQSGVGVYTSNVFFSDASFIVGAGQPTSFNFTITPAVAVAPTSHSTTAVAGQVWTPPFDTAGSGGSQWAWCVVGWTSFGDTFWVPPGSAIGNTYQFYVAIVADANHVGTVSDPSFPGTTLAMSGPYSVNVVAPPAPTASISAIPSSGTAPASTTITWSSTNGTSVSVTGPGLSSSAAAGSQSVGPLPAGLYTYTITASNIGGSAVQSAVFTVTASASPAPSASISASPSSGDTSTSSLIGWSTSNASSATVTGPGLSSSSLSGGQFVGPFSAGTYTYTINASGPGGSTTQTATFTVAASPVTASISASPTTGSAPASTTISWSTANATLVSVLGPGLSSAASTGSQSVGPFSAGTYTYTITAQGVGGPAVSSATLTVAAPGVANVSITGTTNFGSGYRDSLAGSPTATSEVLTVSNTGGSACTITSLTISGPFSILSGPANGTVLAAGASTPVTIQFTPGSALGTDAGLFQVNTTANSPAVSLSGTGMAPQISVNWP